MNQTQKRNFKDEDDSTRFGIDVKHERLKKIKI
jgi:hypothetical protein